MNHTIYRIAAFTQVLIYVAVSQFCLASESETIDGTIHQATQDSVWISGDNCNLWIHLPTSFNANTGGDTQTTGFGNFLPCQVIDYEFKLYDRWEQLRYTSSDQFEIWDGKSNGKLVPTGSYFYTLTFSGPDAKKYNFSKTLVIVR